MENVQFENSSLFLQAFLNAPIGMALVGTDGRWLKVNPSLCEIVGYSEEELLNSKVQDLTHPDDLEQNQFHVKQMLRGEVDKCQFEKRYIHKDGHWIWILLSVSLVRNDRNEPEFFISQIQEISDRKIADRRQRRHLEQIEKLSYQNSLILNSVAEGIYGLDLNKRIMFCNPAASKLLGYPIEELLGKTPAETFRHHIPISPEEYYRQLAEKNVHVISGESFYRKDGSSFPVEYTTTPILDKGMIVGAVVNFTDISDRLHTEQLMEQQEQIDLELSLAASVQESLLPTLQSADYPDKTELGVLSVPARILNGDFYNFASKDDNFLMGVADISGKGIPAAILMSMMKFAMDATLQNSHMPDAVLRLLNRFVDKYSNLSTFVTMFIGSYNKRNGHFYYANAGHEPAILYRVGTGTFEDLEKHGPVLGLFHEYVYQTHHVELQPGDMILVYTDGVIENRNCEEADTNTILKQLLKQMGHSLSPQEIVEQMLQSIREQQGGNAADDQTLLLFKRTE